METFIIILLIVITLYLYALYKELRHTNDLLQRTWQGMFNDPNGGLGMLVYLRYIHTELEKIEKLTGKTKEKIDDIGETTDIIKDEVINKN